MLIVLFCIFATGCNNEFARAEYDVTEKIVKTEDRYAKKMSVFNSIEGGYKLTASKFDGRETLWSGKAEENQSMDVKVNFQLSKGQAKLVHIDGEDNLTTVIECLPDTSTDDYVTKTVFLTKGKNRFKVVGYDCEDMKLQILFEAP